jgi:OFA family oxalate/formate antiporter-like MFS transporter
VSGILASLGLLLLSNSIRIYLLIIGLGVFEGFFAVIKSVFLASFLW